MRQLIVFVLALFCTQEAASESYHKALIFVPGFKGSKLAEVESHRTVWVSVQEAVFGSRSLTLSHKAFPFASGLALEPVSILRSIPLIPKLFERALYGDFLDYIRRDLGAEFKIVEIAYDWRLSNINSADRIQVELKQLVDNGYDEITIIAHSMGGLGAAHALKQLVSIDASPLANLRELKIVFVATPFAGVPSVLGDLTRRNSSSVLINSKLLSQRAFCSFESSYELLPMLKNVGPFALSDANVWERNKLGCFNEQPVDKDGYRELLNAQLPTAQALLKGINDQTPLTRKFPVKILNLVGTSIPTSNGCHLRSPNNPDSLVCTEPTELESGDGVVTVEAAKLSPFLLQFAHDQKYFLGGGHLEMLFEDEPRAEIKKLISSEFAAPSS